LEIVAGRVPKAAVGVGYGARMPWLVKTEPETYSIDDLKRERRTRWDGIRNYQARNTMRDLMKVGDEVLIYHSNAEPPGVVGLARVSAPVVPDRTALDPASPYHDPRATEQDPVWLAIELAFVERFPRLVSLEEIRATPTLAAMPLLARGQRLSVQPVTEKECQTILAMARGVAPAARSVPQAKKRKKPS
jgi:predicted RNA-binding protein with PUA-like domain